MFSQLSAHGVVFPTRAGAAAQEQQKKHPKTESGQDTPSSLMHWSQNFPRLAWGHIMAELPSQVTCGILCRGSLWAEFVHCYHWDVRCFYFISFYFKQKKTPICLMNVFISLPADSTNFWLDFLITNFIRENVGMWAVGLVKSSSSQKLDWGCKAHLTLSFCFGPSLDTNNC